jgi:hypothetical protein
MAMLNVPVDGACTAAKALLPRSLAVSKDTTILPIARNKSTFCKDPGNPLTEKNGSSHCRKTTVPNLRKKL